jgi:hypothetical protein
MIFVRFEVFMALKIWIVVFWDMVPFYMVTNIPEELRPSITLS